MAGLISSTTTPYTQDATTSTIGGVTTINPAKITQTQDWQNTPDQTVAGQLSTITASDSPLMQQARARASQGMNGRGLLNSSMAIGAADSAMYDAAMPIAQADAAQASKVTGYNVDTRNTTGLRNMEASNWAAGINAGASNDFSKMNKQQGFDLTKMDKNQEFNLQTLGQQQSFQAGQSALDRGQQTAITDKQIQAQKDITNTQTTAARDVAEMEATYKTITQGSSAATSIMQNMQNALNLLAANKDITDATKRTAMEAQIKQNAKDSLEMIGALAGDADIAKYLS